MVLFKRTLFTFLPIILIGSCIVCAQDLTEWESILSGADMGDILVSSGNGNVLFEYVRVDSLSTRAQEMDQEHRVNLAPDVEVVVRNQENIEIYFAFAGEKMRCEESSMNRLPTGRWYTQEWQWAYNREKLDLLRLDGLGEKGLIIPKGSIRTDIVPRLNRFDPRHNGLKIMGTQVGDFLRGSLGDKNVENLTIIREEAQDNILCKVIQGNIVDSGDIITVWLAQNIMYRPKHIELNSSNEITVVHNTFREYREGIWFPEIVKKEEYYIDDVTGERILYNREKILVQNDFEINIELLSTIFEVEFPQGLWVYDYRIGEKFEIK